MTADSDHASLEELSAYLDGEAPDLAAHVDGCAQCQETLARLREVVAAVGRPVPPPPPASVDRAVARALGRRPASGAATGAAAVEPDPPVRQPWRARPVLVGVASGSIAAVLLAVVAAFAVIGRDGNDRQTDTALATRPEAAQDRATAAAGSGPQPAPVAGGQLGEVGDGAGLAARLQGRIPGTAGYTATAMAASPQAAEAGGSPSAPVPCETAARAAVPTLGPVVYMAEGFRDGRPVVVLGFAGPPVSLLVLARPSCAAEFATEVP